MGFVSGARRGSLWEDFLLIDELIKKHDFNISGKKEREFENGFAHTLAANNERFQHDVITQLHRKSHVIGVDCFGKKHRPDMAIGSSGDIKKDIQSIGIEIKYIKDSPDIFKYALGQAMVYRIRYKFVALILILSHKNKPLYEVIATKQQLDLNDILYSLAEEMKIFTYIVPAFEIKYLPKTITFFDHIKS